MLTWCWTQTLDIANYRSGNNQMQFLDYYHVDWIKFEFVPDTDSQFANDSTLLEAFAWYDPDGSPYANGEIGRAAFDLIASIRPIVRKKNAAFCRNGISLFVRNPRITTSRQFGGSGGLQVNTAIEKQGVFNGGASAYFASFNIALQRLGVKPSVDLLLNTRVTFKYTTWGQT